MCVIPLPIGYAQDFAKLFTHAYMTLKGSV
jgi:hypothetical protein